MASSAAPSARRTKHSASHATVVRATTVFMVRSTTLSRLLCLPCVLVCVCPTTGAARRERRKQEKERREQQRREEASRKGPKYKNLTPDDVKELANNKDYSWLRAAAGPSKCVHTGVIDEPVWLTLCACLYGAAGE